MSCAIKYPYVTPMFPISYVVQKAGRSCFDHVYCFLNHIGNRAHRLAIGERQLFQLAMRNRVINKRGYL